MVIQYVEFSSRVGRTMAALIWGCVFIMLTAAGMTLVDTDAGPAARVLVMLVSGVTVPLLIWYRFNTSYRLTDTHLLIHSGPMRKRILLDEIISVKPDRNLQSAPALSFDRFVIRYRNYDSISISPEERGEFLQELAARAPHLIWQDSHLVALT